jgi:sulfoxide reductase heme-binding subunit YedZ
MGDLAQTATATPAARPRAHRAPPTPWLKPGVFIGALVPLAFIVLQAARGKLGANPIAEGLNNLGLVALIFLIGSLAATPLKTLTGWGWPIRLRRMLGLFAFFYASLHLLTYAGLDQGLDLRAVWKDVTKRPFIFVGMAAFAAMVPLALTSTAASVKRMGNVAWKRLHRLAYLAAALGAVHFYLRVKKDVREPVLYAIVLGVLLLARLVTLARKKLLLRQRTAGVPAPSGSPAPAE